MFTCNYGISIRELKNSKHENLVRLAKYLKLHCLDNMSHRQLARLIRWRLTREDMIWYVF